MELSVIIAVRNEVNRIEECLQSVFNQDHTEAYEVIVVDGMSVDGTYELLEKLQKKHDFTLLKNPKFNAAAGRNIGIKHTKGDLIAFIDGDAVAAKDWLRQITKTFEKRNVIGVGGPDSLPEDGHRTAKMIGYVMTSPLARGGKLNPSTQHALMEEETYVEHIPTCNLCLKREVFDKVGFFDETFVKGQDLELNYRIIKAGYKLLYSPKIRVIHHRKQHVNDFAKQIFKWAKAKIAIIKKHGFHGLISHIYLWPAYALIAFFASFSIFLLSNLMNIFVLLIFFTMLSYTLAILFESARLAKKFGDSKLLLYAAFLLPVVHISYACGVMDALLRRKIW
jgi:GT2 family glycosyltransferase